MQSKRPLPAAKRALTGNEHLDITVSRRSSPAEIGERLRLYVGCGAGEVRVTFSTPRDSTRAGNPPVPSPPGTTFHVHFLGRNALNLIVQFLSQLEDQGTFPFSAPSITHVAVRKPHRAHSVDLTRRSSMRRSSSSGPGTIVHPVVGMPVGPPFPHPLVPPHAGRADIAHYVHPAAVCPPHPPVLPGAAAVQIAAAATTAAATADWEARREASMGKLASVLHAYHTALALPHDHPVRTAAAYEAEMAVVAAASAAGAAPRPASVAMAAAAAAAAADANAAAAAATSLDGCLLAERYAAERFASDRAAAAVAAADRAAAAAAADTAAAHAAAQRAAAAAAADRFATETLHAQRVAAERAAAAAVREHALAERAAADRLAAERAAAAAAAEHQRLINSRAALEVHTAALLARERARASRECAAIGPLGHAVPLPAATPCPPGGYAAPALASYERDRVLMYDGYSDPYAAESGGVVASAARMGGPGGHAGVAASAYRVPVDDPPTHTADMYGGVAKEPYYPRDTALAAAERYAAAAALERFGAPVGDGRTAQRSALPGAGDGHIGGNDRLGPAAALDKYGAVLSDRYTGPTSVAAAAMDRYLNVGPDACSGRPGYGGEGRYEPPIPRGGAEDGHGNYAGDGYRPMHIADYDGTDGHGGHLALEEDVDRADSADGGPYDRLGGGARVPIMNTNIYESAAGKPALTSGMQQLQRELQIYKNLGLNR